MRGEVHCYHSVHVSPYASVESLSRFITGQKPSCSVPRQPGRSHDLAWNAEGSSHMQILPLHQAVHALSQVSEVSLSHTILFLNMCHFIRTVESGDERSSGIGELFSEQVSHLPQSHQEFFAKWYKLVAEEEAYSKRSTGPPVWLTTAQERYVHVYICVSVPISTTQHGLCIVQWVLHSMDCAL